MAASRILLRAAALGLAASTACSLHAMSRWTPSGYISPVTPDVKRLLMKSTLGLQASLLRVHHLSGVHLGDVRARAEHDLASADAEGGDMVEAADLHLLLAHLAARDGRTDEVLRLYEEAACDIPFNPRPSALAFHICLLAGRMDEVESWRAAYRRLVPDLVLSTMLGLERNETRELVHELVIAATLGGIYSLDRPEERKFVLTKACGTVDEGLVITLQDKAISMAEKLQLRALRVYLHAKVGQLIKKNEQEMTNDDDDAW